MSDETASHVRVPGPTDVLPKRPNAFTGPNRPGPRTSPSRSDWAIPALLVALSVVPVVAGAFRLTELASGAEITPANARFFDDPLPVVLHILSASLFSVVGAFQFSPGLRRRNLRWHRTAGRLLVPLGLVAAISGLWLTLGYPPVEPDGNVLYLMRLGVGSLMAACIVWGVFALLRRDFRVHGAWMMRGYALGLGAGTQVLTHLLWAVTMGEQDEIGRVVVMGGGWAINIAVAEWHIRRRSRSRARPGRARTAGIGWNRETAPRSEASKP